MHKLILSCLFLMSLFSSQAQTNTQTISQFIDALAKADYPRALNHCSVEFKAKVTEQAISGLWQNFNQQYGPYESYSMPDSVGADSTPITVSILFKDFSVPMTFHLNVQHEIIGLFSQQTPKRRDSGSNSPAGFPQEDLKVKVNGGIISGTILTPKNPATGMPVALIIAGSGPTNRDGNSPAGLQTNSYLLLAEALADHGIASFRYDKRLIGESTGFDKKQEQTTFQDFVDDAIILGQFLRTRKEFGKLFIIGHSEGSNIGILAAQQLHPAAFVSLCGPGQDLASVIREQLAHQPKLAQQAEPILQLLLQGNTTANVPTELNSIFTPSVQPFLISSFKINPAEEINKLNIPILIIGGTNDLQIPILHAKKLKEAAPSAQLLLIKDMNHVLKAAPSDRSGNLATYRNLRLPLHSDLVIGLVNFLRDFH